MTTTPEGQTKSLGEKLFDAERTAYPGNFKWMEWEQYAATFQARYERIALAFAASLSHDETAGAVIASLTARAEASEQRADELTKAFDLLVSSVLAARTTNTRAYMEGLADDLNVALAAFGDPDRVAFERGSFSVIRATTKSGEA